MAEPISNPLYIWTESPLIISALYCLANAIDNIFGENSFIKASEEDLKFEVSFEYEEIDEKEIKEDDDLIKSCKMMTELFEIEQDNYLLEFNRMGGRTIDYYHHFYKIKKILKKKLY